MRTTAALATPWPDAAPRLVRDRSTDGRVHPLVRGSPDPLDAGRADQARPAVERYPDRTAAGLRVRGLLHAGRHPARPPRRTVAIAAASSLGFSSGASPPRSAASPATTGSCSWRASASASARRRSDPRPIRCSPTGSRPRSGAARSGSTPPASISVSVSPPSLVARGRRACVAPAAQLPLLGELAAWHATFLLVGVPGLLVAIWVATLPEPTRRGVASDAAVAPPLAEVRLPLRRNAGFFAAHFLGFSLLTMAFNSIVFWMAAVPDAGAWPAPGQFGTTRRRARARFGGNLQRRPVRRLAASSRPSGAEIWPASSARSPPAVRCDRAGRPDAGLLVVRRSCSSRVLRSRPPPRRCRW